MASEKAHLEATIRARRARLDRRLHQLETRIEAVKDTGKRLGMVTGAVVVTLAVLAMVGTIVMAIRRSVRRR
jgi:hypothetical protein